MTAALLGALPGATPAQAQRVGADVAATAADGTTPLHRAVTAGDRTAVTRLIRAGADVNAVTRYGVTPLAIAAMNGDGETVELLLAANAAVDTPLADGETALMLAARSGSVRGVQALVRRGAAVDTREQWHGETALMWAAAENHSDVVKVLVEAGADISARSKSLSFPQFRFTTNGMVTTELPRGGWTPVMYAARQGAREAAVQLARSGADLDAADSLGTTPLILAIINAHFDLAMALIDEGAWVDAADQTGMTPLYAAVDMHSLEWMFNRPLPRSADRADAADVARALLDRGADPDAVLARPLLQRHHDAGDNTMGPGTTPLMRAAKTGDLAVVQLLLTYGADARRAQKSGATVLMIAAGIGFRDRGPGLFRGTEQDSIDIIRLCLARGADINAVNDRSETALHGAVVRGADRIIEFLGTNGARLDLKNEQGQTPLDLALNPGARRARRDSTVALLQKLAAR